MLGLVHSFSDRIKTGIHRQYDYVKHKVTSIVYIITVFIVILWLSVFMYGTFYYTYVPSFSRVEHVHLEFSVCDDGVGMCSFPTANLSLLKEGEDEVFARGQIYSIILGIELPESPQNQNLGNFMVKLDLYNHAGKTITSVSRLAILHFRSMLLRIMDTFTFSPFLLFGWMEQRQSLSVEFFSKYQDDSYNPAIGAVIQVMSRKIDLYSTKLFIQAHFTGYRYILFHWPVFSAVFGISFNFVALLFIFTLSWYQFGRNDVSKSEFDMEPVDKPWARSELEPESGSGSVTPQLVGLQDDEETELLSTNRAEDSILECHTALQQ
ncbi:seipin-like [Pecten maximus]|uniref:seipin-like n=1 Tax=Pecten maximus TaxID=6579 RepID=UPI0014582B8E|nr:seipin-like [Pecten maximus]